MSLEPQGSLKKRTIQAGGWKIFVLVCNNSMRLGSNLVMTRLLVPEAFGLMSFVMTVMTAFNLIGDLGIQRSIIRDPEGNTARYLRAVFAFRLFRATGIAISILFTALLFGILAPGWAQEGTVYADPLMPYLLAAVASLPLIRALKSPNAMLAARLFHNKRAAAVGLTGQAAAILTQISIALIWPSVWSLIIGFLTGEALRSILSHFVFQGPRMAWAPDREISRKIWHFGKFLMVSSMLTLAANSADKLILASFLGASSFGLYAIAVVWIGAGQTVLKSLSNGVGFAALGEVIRNRPAEAPRQFKRFQRVIDGLSVATFLVTFLLGERFIHLLYTEQYATAGQYLTLLSLSFLALRFTSMDSFVLNNGNSRAMMVISAIRTVAILIFLPLGYNLIGIEGALLAVALMPLASTPYTIYLIRPLLGAGYAGRQVLWVLAILITAVAVYLSYSAAIPGAISL